MPLHSEGWTLQVHFRYIRFIDFDTHHSFYNENDGVTDRHVDNDVMCAVPPKKKRRKKRRLNEEKIKQTVLLHTIM